MQLLYEYTYPRKGEGNPNLTVQIGLQNAWGIDFDWVPTFRLTTSSSKHGMKDPDENEHWWGVFVTWAIGFRWLGHELTVRGWGFKHAWKTECDSETWKDVEALP